MAVTINASTSTGLVQSADTSGEIELQSNGTTALKVNTNEGIQILNCLGVGNATPSTSGAGITFPATQSASSDANTLDDYEEGTWTPTLGRNGGANTVTYTVQSGKYTKIGNVVYVSFSVHWSANSGGSGNFHVAGLPFTVSSGDASYTQMFMNDFNGITFPASTTYAGGEASIGLTRIGLVASGSAVASTAIPTVGNSGYIYMTGFYYV